MEPEKPPEEEEKKMPVEASMTEETPEPVDEEPVTVDINALLKQSAKKGKKGGKKGGGAKKDAAKKPPT